MASGTSWCHRALPALLALAAACSGPDRRDDRPARRADPRRAADEDLLALLPAGLDAVLDVETRTLRGLPGVEALLPELPLAATQALSACAEDPLRDLEALGVGVIGLGTPGVDVILVCRGKVSWERLEAAVLAAAPDAALGEYHGVALRESQKEREGAGRAAALLTPRTGILGGRAAVRQAIDNLHGDGESARTQGELMAALRKAPRARSGRPALLLSLLPSAAIRDRLREADLAEIGADAAYLAAALAAGDGIDLGVVAGYRELGVARDVAQRLKERAAGLRRRPALRLLGLDALLDPLQIVAALAGPRKRDPELHLAYRLAGEDLQALLTRIQAFREIRKRTGP